MSAASREDMYRRRMMHLLAAFALERTGWRSLFGRWFYADEPLRNDAANLLAEMGYRPIYPVGSMPLPPLQG